MALCPFAEQLLLPDGVNHEDGGIRPRLYIVHIMQGTLEGTDAEFRNPENQVSAHFGIGDGRDEYPDGHLIQWVDTDNMAWHAAGANPYAIGVEHAGWSGNPLTDAQIRTTARLFDWCSDQHPEIAHWLNSRPYTGRGLSWHGLGGQDWGNHPNCPGVPIVHQLPLILRLSDDGEPG